MIPPMGSVPRQLEGGQASPRYRRAPHMPEAGGHLVRRVRRGRGRGVTPTFSGGTLVGPALSLWRRHRLQLAFGPAQRRRAPLPTPNSGSYPIHRAHARAAAAGCPQPTPKLSLLKSQHAHQPLAAQPARPRRRGQREKKPLAGTIVYHPVGAAGSRSKGTNVGTVFTLHSITNS